jgi:hypothetical protein
MLEMFKFYKKKLYGSFRLDLFMKDKKIMFAWKWPFLSCQTSSVRMDGWMDGWTDGGKTWFKRLLRAVQKLTFAQSLNFKCNLTLNHLLCTKLELPLWYLTIWFNFWKIHKVSACFFTITFTRNVLFQIM